LSVFSLHDSLTARHIGASRVMTPPDSSRSVPQPPVQPAVPLVALPLGVPNHVGGVAVPQNAAPQNIAAGAQLAEAGNAPPIYYPAGAQHPAMAPVAQPPAVVFAAQLQPPVPLSVPRAVPVSGGLPAGSMPQRTAQPGLPLPVPRQPSPAALSSATQPGQPRPAIPARPIPLKKNAHPLAVSDRTTPLDEEEQSDPKRLLMKNAPPFLISSVVHMILVLLLALWLIPINFTENTVLEVSMEEDIWAEALGDQVLAETMMEVAEQDPDQKEVEFSPNELPPVEDPFAAPTPVEIVPDGVTATSAIVAPVNGIADGRQIGNKKGLLARFGGTKTTEEAVINALRWLKKQQRPDGSWSLKGPYSDPGAYENPVAATAMALLAYQGFGITHLPDANTEHSKEFQPVVKKGWEALIKMQDADGLFTSAAIDNHNHMFYTHGQCTIAVCELYAMTKDEKFKLPAQRAIDYCVKTQDPLRGGWRYLPQNDSDTSVTGWILVGLMSGRMGGLDVPEATLEKISRYLDAAQTDGGSQYSYRPNYSQVNAAMTAEGLLMRQYLGWDRNDERLVNGVRKIVAYPVNIESPNVYYWYYATQVCHHMEGDYWKEWNAVMRQVIPSAQVKTGAEAGSWDPGEDEWGHQGGRLFCTCMCTYMLETYYRHMPIYDKLYEAKPGQLPQAQPKLEAPATPEAQSAAN
jgi:hypothetical protein